MDFLRLGERFEVCDPRMDSDAIAYFTDCLRVGKELSVTMNSEQKAMEAFVRKVPRHAKSS